MNYFFTRHAESRGNANAELYHTVLDHHIDLTEKGETQAVFAADKIISLYDTIKTYSKDFFLYYSPYLRAEKTKNNLVKELNYNYIFPKETMSPLIVERRWGNLRNTIREEKEVDKYFDFFYQPIDGESYLQCYQRCVTFDNSLRLNHTKGDNIIIVAHGELITCYLMYLLNWSVEEFRTKKNPANCEVIMVNDGILSPLTLMGERIKN